AVERENTVHLGLIECGEPHKAADTFSAAARFVGCIRSAKGLEILVVESNTVVGYHKAYEFGIRTIVLGQESLRITLDFNLDFAIANMGILNCMDGIHDGLENRQQWLRRRQLHISNTSGYVSIHVWRSTETSDQHKCMSNKKRIQDG